MPQLRASSADGGGPVVNGPFKAFILASEGETGSGEDRDDELDPHDALVVHLLASCGVVLHSDLCVLPLPQ